MKLNSHFWKLDIFPAWVADRDVTYSMHRNGRRSSERNQIPAHVLRDIGLDRG